MSVAEIDVTAPGGGRIRCLRPPAHEPPYDDEPRAHPAVTPLQGTLPLALAGPPATEPGGELRAVQNFRDPSAGAAQRGTAGPVAARLVRVLVETLAGGRPIGQLARWLTPPVVSAVSRRAATAQRSGSARPLATVRSVHVCEPAPGVAEVCALVESNARVRAFALRLESADGEWRCTALQMG